MIQLVIMGIILYVFLYLLAKLNIFNGITRVLSVVNTGFLIFFSIFVLVKTGLLRAITGFLSFLLIRITDFFGSLF